MAGFLFGGRTGLSYQDLQDRRATADALQRKILGQQPRNTMEGVGALLTGAAAGISRYQANKGLREGQEKQAALFDTILSRITGEPVTPGAGGTASNLPMPGAAAELAATSPGNDYFSTIRAAESRGNDQARNPNSSATGRYQFIDSTWRGLMQKYPELGLTADGRTDPAQQEKAIQAFTRDNASVLQGAGIPTTGGNLYAAHFLGAGGAQKVLTADPSSPVSAYVSPQVIQANPFLRGMSVGDFQKWAGRKGGGNQPVNLGGNQVASLDPTAGMPSAAAAIETQAPGSGYVDPRVSAPNAQAPMPGNQPQMPMAGNQPAPFDAGRFGDPIKLSEDPAAMGDVGPRLGSQASAYAADPQGPVAGLQPMPGQPPMATKGARVPGPFDDGRFGDPIKLSEMPAGMDDAGQRLGSQATAYAANPQMPVGGLQSPPATPPGRQIGPAPQVAGAPQPMRGPAPVQQPAPVQVAQAGPASMPPQIPQFQPYQISRQAIEFLSSPFSDPGHKQALMMAIQQQQDAHNQQQQQRIWQAKQDYEQWQRVNDPQYIANLDQTRAQTARLKDGTRPATADDRRAWGIPDNDTRPYKMTPDGPVLVGGSGQTINIGGQIEARKNAAEVMGLKPDDPRYMGYVLNGELPKESQQNLTAIDKKAIQDADDMVIANQSALDALAQASKLSESANSGWFAGTRAAVGNNLPDWMVPDIISSPESSQATTDMDNAIIGQAVTQLKTIFGGSPTEGERAILLELQGSSSMPKPVRKKVFERAKALAEKRLQFNQNRANDLRGGTYYKSSRAPSGGPVKIGNYTIEAE